MTKTYEQGKADGYLSASANALYAMREIDKNNIETLANSLHVTYKEMLTNDDEETVNEFSMYIPSNSPYWQGDTATANKVIAGMDEDDE